MGLGESGDFARAKSPLSYFMLPCVFLIMTEVEAEEAEKVL